MDGARQGKYQGLSEVKPHLSEEQNEDNCSQVVMRERESGVGLSQGAGQRF